MAEHKHANAWRWIADGESIQARRTGFTKAQEWAAFPNDFEPRAAFLALMGDEQWEFRITPRTLIIAGRQIEPPLGSISGDKLVYVSNADGGSMAIKFSLDIKEHYHAFLNGRLFATPEAAKAAYDAITALLVPGG